MRRMFAVLRAVPAATLWLLSGPENADERLHAAAREDGVDPTRIVFMPKLPHDEYLARYRHADLFLDTTPYNAHTTASDAIWAGCPLLTVPGSTFAARVAASLNAHLGMPALNAADDASFIETAVRIGRTRRAQRVACRARRTASCQRPLRHASRSRAISRRCSGAMVERHRRGLAPADLD